MKKAILIFGNTCAGKSTLGKKIEKTGDIIYLSFGDIKRLEISKGSFLGKKLESIINKNLPIDPRDGLVLLKKYHFNLSNIAVSGYPISEFEYRIFKSEYFIVLGIHLIVADSVIEERFFMRGICPICNSPGIQGNMCLTHNVLMIKRPDATKEELKKRICLFNNRIIPFLDLVLKKSLFPLKEYDFFNDREQENIIKDLHKYLK